MRVFALSDVHVDYPDNLQWLEQLSRHDYQDDVLILAGDVSDLPDRIATTFQALRPKFRSVLFVPGNHDLWVRRCAQRTSLEKFEFLQQLAREHDVLTAPCRFAELLLVPLLGWYDGTFGEPSVGLQRQWMDFRFCDWEGRSDREVTDHFLALNEHTLSVVATAADAPTVISFSHFLPRIDVMPSYIPERFRSIYPVLGSARLDAQVETLAPAVHVYGHSHVNRQVRLSGRLYVNNALGGPSETRICARELVCVYEQ